MISIIKSPWVYIPALSVLLVVVLIMVVGGEKDQNIETELLSRYNIEQIVTETGVVDTRQSVTLSFEKSGRVAEINVAEGDSVSANQVLAYLDDSAERSELRSAEARLEDLLAGVSVTGEASALARVNSAEVSLESARRNLLTSGLEAHFTGDHIEESVFSYEPPTVSGTYTGENEGEYIITLYRSGSQSGYSFNYSGLEFGVGEVSTQTQKPLGNKGLYIKFPNNFAKGSQVEWRVQIPNSRSANYTSNRRAYEQAKSARDQAVAEYKLAIEGARPEQVRVQEGVVDVVRTALERTRIRAPFAGVVSRVVVSRGEFVSVGVPAIDLMSDDGYEITVYVSEADIAELSFGDRATVRLDAYRDDVFEAEVVSISPRARRVDGISSFETVLILTGDDPRIRAGLTGDVDISVSRAENVFAVPARAIVIEDGKRLIRVAQSDGSLKNVEVTTGLRGIDGRVEITGNLSEGDEIVTFIR